MPDGEAGFHQGLPADTEIRPVTANFEDQSTNLELIDHRYRVLRRLGGGAFGTVYECCDETLQLTVAVKLPNELACGSVATRSSFLAEARTLASLDHRRIMKVRDFREMSGGRCYAVFEFIDGLPFQEHLSSIGNDRVALIGLIADIAEALHAVHAAELVHRDIKPANILVRAGGDPCLVDFGLAISDDLRREHTGEFAGTPAYMAPEQVRRESHLLDGRADIWALGVILYEGLTGKRPFHGRNFTELQEEILHREPKPLRILDPSIPRILEQIVLSCLRKPTSQRPLTAMDLAETLRSQPVVESLKQVETTEGPRQKPKSRWASDGHLVDIAYLKDLVFETPLIRSFLESDHQFFISANKGLGKTLLLRYKRSLLTEQYSPDHHPDQKQAAKTVVHFIPEGRPYLDFMSSELPALSRGHHKFLSELRNGKRLWSFALRVSTITYFPEIASQVDDVDLNTNYRQIREWFHRPHVQPTAIFKEMLSLSVRDLNQLLDQCENWLDYLFCRAHAGVFIFVDRVEQGLHGLPRECWVNVQAGLLEAAWDVMSANSHVKVYATIREEAYANYESDIRANYHSATVALRYSVEDLRQMIDKLANFYESSGGLEEFIGLNEVHNPSSQLVENCFQYLQRHTIGRPRDLVIVCSELSKRRTELSEPLYREIVNEVSSKVIVANVFNEMANLIDCLNNKTERQRFFSMLPYNLLSMEEMRRICCQFNGLEQADYEDFRSTGEALHHPFCELYNCGLLGVVRENLHDSGRVQYFKQSHDVLGTPGSCLPVSDYYLIHPSLQSQINQQHAGSGYQPFRFITVGHRYPWQRHFHILISLQKSLFLVNDPDLRDDVSQLLKSIVIANGDQQQKQTLPDVSGIIRAVQAVQQKLERRNFEDLFLMLDELVNRLL